MSKHTPGPWHTDTERGYLHDPDWGRFQVYDAEGYVVAVTIGDTTEMAQAEEANARLIAAAPELLAALEKMRAELRTHVKLDVQRHFSLLLADEMARDAIAKANKED